ncbi:MAG: hypothetical protein II892_00535 [Fibrobacter sp.]|nr:hypothetical protein [Fibrobacter sp.]
MTCKHLFLFLAFVCLCANAQSVSVSARFCAHKSLSNTPQKSNITLSCYALTKKMTDSITYSGHKIGESVVAKVQNADSVLSPYIYLSDGIANLGEKTITKQIPINLESMSFHYFSKDSAFVKRMFNTQQYVLWNYYLNTDSSKQTISGKEPIYISGFCTEEQLEIIRKRKKESSKLE